MVIISHQERIISLADEILVIDKGVIARRGTRDEVFTDIVHSTTGGCPVIYGEAKKSASSTCVDSDASGSYCRHEGRQGRGRIQYPQGLRLRRARQHRKRHHHHENR